jgi:hypothetical protein
MTTPEHREAARRAGVDLLDCEDAMLACESWEEKNTST